MKCYSLFSLLIFLLLSFCTSPGPIGGVCKSDGDCFEGECLDGMCAGSCDTAGDSCSGSGLCTPVLFSLYCLPICSSDDDCDVGSCTYTEKDTGAPVTRRCLFRRSEIDKKTADTGCTCSPYDVHFKGCSSNLDCGYGAICVKGETGSISNPVTSGYCLAGCPAGCNKDADCMYCKPEQSKCIKRLCSQ